MCHGFTMKTHDTCLCVTGFLMECSEPVTHFLNANPRPSLTPYPYILVLIWATAATLLVNIDNAKTTYFMLYKILVLFHHKPMTHIYVSWVHYENPWHMPVCHGFPYGSSEPVTHFFCQCKSKTVFDLSPYLGYYLTYSRRASCENFNRLSTVHEHYRQIIRQQTDFPIIKPRHTMCHGFTGFLMKAANPWHTF